MIRTLEQYAVLASGMALFAFTLAGCASQYDYDAPKVDMKGVNESRYLRDVDDCVDRKIDGGLAYNQPTITNCMRDRGYIITTKGG